MRNIMLHRIFDFMQLCRLKIALFASISAVFGLVLAGQHDFSGICYLFTGVFLVASGASALNQYQERATDALMARTKDRPLPSGRHRPANALLFALAVSLAGFGMLAVGAGILSAAIGLFAVIWYNGVYTYLKRTTAFAVVPGSLTGSLVPAMGWAAGGGDLTDPRLIAICVYFGLWQTPHFWLLIYRYGREYELAGLPSMTSMFSSPQISRLTFIWIAATAVCGLILLLFIPTGAAAQILISSLSVWLVWQGTGFMIRGKDDSNLIFVKLNSYMLVIMTLLCCDNLWQNSMDGAWTFVWHIVLGSSSLFV
jgi:heme o synthase